MFLAEGDLYISELIVTRLVMVAYRSDRVHVDLMCWPFNWQLTTDILKTYEALSPFPWKLRRHLAVEEDSNRASDQEEAMPHLQIMAARPEVGRVTI
ncbi:hypothetical protein RRG08_028919 [Elysia crispata]|uniref:Uncharacterized protein n=1 Tax=Elysia crispata TaxID=231223 RepID=A0AAE1AR46_9GAST|nr:hypothetical protein RRG08_028919 [Elysia crispata]